ncbi:response regulator [Aquiflexum sp.]|uniref:response regulator n=1 Tax=Aquiflexum sp. TaxID=1872584 RepID=UPI003593A370
MKREVHILLVEDNEGDVILTTEAFEDRKIVNKISVARDGQEALDFIYRRNKYEGGELPDLILLDINLPKISGHEVLEIIKNDETVMHIPVIMLTTSSSEKDLQFSYKNHANCFITKPVEVESFLDAITKIEDFWLSIVSLPK